MFARNDCRDRASHRSAAAPVRRARRGPVGPPAGRPVGPPAAPAASRVRPGPVGPDPARRARARTRAAVRRARRVRSPAPRAQARPAPAAATSTRARRARSARFRRRSLGDRAVRHGDREQRRSRGRRGRRRGRRADVHAVPPDGPAAGRPLPPRDHVGQRHRLDAQPLSRAAQPPRLARLRRHRVQQHERRAGRSAADARRRDLGAGTERRSVERHVPAHRHDPHRRDRTLAGRLRDDDRRWRRAHHDDRAPVRRAEPATCTDRRCSSAAAWTPPFRAAPS